MNTLTRALTGTLLVATLSLAGAGIANASPNNVDPAISATTTDSLYSLQQNNNNVVLTANSGHFEDRQTSIVLLDNKGIVVDSVEKTNAFDYVLTDTSVTFSKPEHSRAKRSCGAGKFSAVYGGTATATAGTLLIGAIFAPATAGLSLAGAAALGAGIGATGAAAGIGAAGAAGCFGD